MSILLTQSEIEYVRYLYSNLYNKYLDGAIYNIIKLDEQYTLKLLLKQYLYKENINLFDLQLFFRLIKTDAFKYFNDIIYLNKNNIIIISDLYKLLPLIKCLISIYSYITYNIYCLSLDVIRNITISNYNHTANQIILNTLMNNYYLIKLLKDLEAFIITRNINDKIKDSYDHKIKELNSRKNMTVFSTYLSTFNNIISSYKIEPETENNKININCLNKYLNKYIIINNNFIGLFIRNILELLLVYFRYISTIENIGVDDIEENIEKLFNYIAENIEDNIEEINNDIITIVILLRSLITLIKYFNYKLYDKSSNKSDYIYIEWIKFNNNIK